MIDKEKTEQAARLWLNDWNNRDFEKVMSHYAEDVEFYSPTVVSRWKEESGKLSGRTAVQNHFLKGIEEQPGMHFQFHAILYGFNSIVLIYKRETGSLSADFVLFDDEGKVKEVRSHWESSSPGPSEVNKLS
jgi:hypothetical protein